MLSLFLHELRIRLLDIIGWGIALILFCSVYVGVYPQIADEFASIDFDSIPLYQAMGMSMISFDGYVASTVFQFLGIILSIYAISSGTGTLVGEEEKGSLEMLVALPMPRWQIVTAKALALSGALFGTLLIGGLGGTAIFLGIQSSLETDVTALMMFTAILKTWPVVFALGMLSLWLGAYLPSRRAAGAIATMILVYSFFGSTLFTTVEALEPLKVFTLYYYSDRTPEVFSSFDWQGLGTLVGIGIAAFGLALLAFDRRNLTVGAWPWQRPAK